MVRKSPQSSSAATAPASASAPVSAPGAASDESSAHFRNTTSADVTSPNNPLPLLRQFTQDATQLRRDNGAVLDHGKETQLLSRLLRELEVFLLQHYKASGVPVVLVQGYQSSSKSTVVNRLAGEPVLPMGQGTCTKFPIVLSLQFEAGDDNSWTAKLLAEPDKRVLEESSRSGGVDLLRWLEDHSAGRDLRFDRSAQITVLKQDERQSVVVIDHPGFCQNYPEEALELSQNSIDKHFGGGSEEESDAILVLCQRITGETGDSGWDNLEQLDRIPDGRLFVAVTMMDTFNHAQVAERVRAIRNLSRNDRAQLTQLDILLALQEEIQRATSKQDPAKRVLPRGTRFFFVAGSKVSSKDLLSNKRQTTWRTFLDSEDESLASFLDEFSDQSKWLAESIELIPMTNAQQKVFDEMVGMDCLVSAVHAKHMESGIRTVRKVEGFLRARLEECEFQASELYACSQSLLDVSSTVVAFLEDFAVQFLSLSREQPFDVETATVMHSAHPLSTETEATVRQYFDHITKYHGWTTEQEMELCREHIGLEPDSFPPSRYMENSNGVKKMTERIARYARNAKSNLSTLPRLNHRHGQEMAIRLVHVHVQDLDMDHMLKKSQQNPGMIGGNLTEVLAVVVQRQYDDIYRGVPRSVAEGMDSLAANSSTNGASTFFATRMATQSLLHGQSVLNLLLMVPKYAALLDPSGSVASKIKSTRDTPVFLVERVAEYSGVGGRGGDRLREKALRDARMRRSLEEPDVGTFADLLSSYQKPMANAFNWSGDFASLREIVERVAIAMYFDAKLLGMKERLESLGDSFRVTLSTVNPTLTACSSLFIHQDPAFLSEYRRTFPMSHFVRAFLSKGVDGADDISILEALIQEIKATGGTLLDMDEHDTDSMYKYADKDAELFFNLPRAVRFLLSATQCLPALDRDARSKLVAMLPRAQFTPDCPVPLQSISDVNRFDTASFNHVNRRIISTSLFEYHLAACRIASMVLYADTHSGGTKRRVLETLERVLSLLLGYPYPYLESERPQELYYLEPDSIIRFVHKHMKELIALFHRKPNDAVAALGGDKPMVLRCALYGQSPLFRHLVGLLVDAPSTADFHVEIKGHYKRLATEGERLGYVRELVKFLLSQSFKKLDARSDVEKKIAVLESERTVYAEAKQSLDLMRRRLDNMFAS
eukprot:ANDGO_06089.mRNA.1 hypothetical protein